MPTSEDENITASRSFLVRACVELIIELPLNMETSRYDPTSLIRIIAYQNFHARAVRNISLNFDTAWCRYYAMLNTNSSAEGYHIYMVLIRSGQGQIFVKVFPCFMSQRPSDLSISNCKLTSHLHPPPP